MNWGFLTAGGFSGVALVLHIMLGRKAPLPPLSGDDPANDALRDAWFGRHIVTVVLLAMSLVFPAASRQPEIADAGLVLGGVGLAAGLLRLGVSIVGQTPRFDAPEWVLVTAAGVSALVGAAFF